MTLNFNGILFLLFICEIPISFCLRFVLKERPSHAQRQRVFDEVLQRWGGN